MLKILIVEGNTRDLRELVRASGYPSQSELFQEVLLSLDGTLETHIVCPADEDGELPCADEVRSYDGIVLTGSALNIYDGGPEIDRQIDFAKQCLQAGSKMFGSCWGLQVGTVALGGKVAVNDKGREIGVARQIKVTDAGAAHPLYQEKWPEFDAVAVHLDHVVEPPEGAIILASNGMSEIQAVEVRSENSVFWGVQYHPEFDLAYLSSIILRLKEPLVAEGLCESLDGAEDWARDFEALGRDPEVAALAEKYDAGRDVLDPSVRLKELANWLDFLKAEKAKG